MVRNASSQRIIATLAAAMCLVLGAGCKNSNDVTGLARNPPATPTRVPLGVNGAWAGQLRPFNIECYVVPVRATFSHEGPFLEGVLETSTNGCVPARIEISGTLTGSDFSGTITPSPSRYQFDAGSTAVGTLTRTEFRITLTDPTGEIPGGIAILHR